MSDLARSIRENALALGYDNCGIIPVETVEDYRDRLDERMSRVPKGRLQFGKFRGLAQPNGRYPEMKSIVVLTVPYTHYNVPDELEGLYAKAYLFDVRLDKHSVEFQRRKKFTDWLDRIGIKHVSERKYGITALRWAAYKAGLGVIRHNNFFYTPGHGSYVFLDAFLIDRRLEWKETVDAKPCPPQCGKCIAACPTKALMAPYTMSLTDCVSFQTSLSVNIPCMGVPSDTMATRIGCRLYGCDLCQDVCPFNNGKMVGGNDFHGLDELLPFLRPERIMEMDYADIDRVFGGKFWYIGPKRLWKWKLNALTVMVNDYRAEYERPIRLGFSDRYAKVRRFAKKACRCLAQNGMNHANSMDRDIR